MHASSFLEALDSYTVKADGGLTAMRLCLTESEKHDKIDIAWGGMAGSGFFVRYLTTDTRKRGRFVVPRSPASNIKSRYCYVSPGVAQANNWWTARDFCVSAPEKEQDEC
jgi:hypothetical protein